MEPAMPPIETIGYSPAARRPMSMTRSCTEPETCNPSPLPLPKKPVIVAVTSSWKSPGLFSRSSQVRDRALTWMGSQVGHWKSPPSAPVIPSETLKLAVGLAAVPVLNLPWAEMPKLLAVAVTLKVPAVKVPLTLANDTT